MIAKQGSSSFLEKAGETSVKFLSVPSLYGSKKISIVACYDSVERSVHFFFSEHAPAFTVSLTRVAYRNLLYIQAPICVCVSVCYVCILSLFVHPNNSPTLINLVCRSLRPAVSGPAAPPGALVVTLMNGHTHTDSHSSHKSDSSVQCSEHIPEPFLSQRPRLVAPSHCL